DPFDSPPFAHGPVPHFGDKLIVLHPNLMVLVVQSAPMYNSALTRNQASLPAVQSITVLNLNKVPPKLRLEAKGAGKRKRKTPFPSSITVGVMSTPACNNVISPAVTAAAMLGDHSRTISK